MTDPRLIGSLVFIFPALILIVPGAGEISVDILAFLGIVKTIKERRNPLAEPMLKRTPSTNRIFSIDKSLFDKSLFVIYPRMTILTCK